MKKTSGFVGIAILSCILALSTAALWWWHSVDLTMRLVYEKKRYYQARYCAEFGLYQFADHVGHHFKNYLIQAKKAEVQCHGLFLWQDEHKKHNVAFTSLIKKIGDDESLLITITVTNNGCQATMKGLLHATDNATEGTRIRLDHVTLCASL